MSFLSSMQQYVTSGISSLGLGGNRRPPSRQESHDPHHKSLNSLSSMSAAAAAAASSSLPLPNLQNPSFAGRNVNLFSAITSSKAGTNMGTTSNVSSAGNQPAGPAGNPLLHHDTYTANSTNAPIHYGYPKVIPTSGIAVTTTASNNLTNYLKAFTSTEQTTPSLIATPRLQRTTEGLIPQRTASICQRQPPAQQMVAISRASLVFCKRRSSWPEVDPRSNSGVEETDGSYFENFVSLGWKHENRRLGATREAEGRAEAIPENERDANAIDDIQNQADNTEKLYMKVLNTISNTVGGPDSVQYASYKEEMYLHAQRAFGINPDQHYRLMQSKTEETSKIVVLSVVVIEAEGLEAKDVNGYSDPYCMLGIQPDGGQSLSPLPMPPIQRDLSADVSGGYEGNVNEPVPHRKHSFRLSFKRRDGSGSGRREQRDSITRPLPAKLISATTIKAQTTNPKWNEQFKFDIDDVNNDIFHLDVWDHDDDHCVMDTVTHLNEGRSGVRGLGRFFKQICQSSRQAAQDDFLGCINIPIADIPWNGMEGWFKLESRNHRCPVQGRIQLKLWLSNRSNEMNSNGDSKVGRIEQVNYLEQLQMIFMQHEIATHEPSWTWCGELSGPALTIFQQMAVQNDVHQLYCAIARFVSAAKLNMATPLDPKFLHRLLNELEKQWNLSDPEILSKDLEICIGKAMNSFLERSLNQIRRHREIFPALNPPSLIRLEFLLRCLGLLGSMRFFRIVCPQSKGVRCEIVNALRIGSVSWAKNILQLALEQQQTNPLLDYVTTLTADIQIGQTYYHSLFDNTNGIQYFTIIYKQFDAIIGEDVYNSFESGEFVGVLQNAGNLTAVEGDMESIDPKPFELYLAVQEFCQLKRMLSAQPQPPEKPLALAQCSLWWLPIFEHWMVVSKRKSLQRIRAAVRLDAICEGERIVRYSSSSVDTAAILVNIKEFWKLISWTDEQSGVALQSQLIDVVCATAMYYCDLMHTALADSGYYEQQGSFRCTDDMCVAVNNLEYVRCTLADFRCDENILEENADNLLESTLAHMENRCERVLSKLAPLMQMSLQKVVFHLAWSPDSLPANQAITPMLEYLNSHLGALNSALLAKNFTRALRFIWKTVLCEMSRQMETGDESEKPSNFHKRLHEALQLLMDFFHADGQGLAIEYLHTDDYRCMEQRLQFRKTDTHKLIEMFYLNCLREQLMANLPGPYGSLTVRAYFNHDSLCVEVLHARDIVPLDPNGFSDPFVIIELLPKRLFPNCMEQRTNVHKKTLNPIFDECFEFSVTLEQCRSESAMICFTIMDHDVLTANDFGGEAFLALSNIPGVADYTSNVDNFHGLKQLELPLMQQRDKNNPIFQILELRANDKQAMDFIRKQKARIIQ